MTTNILVFYVILSPVHLSNISYFFNVFLNQNYELQFSCNVIITCNNKQYIVNYKQQFSFSYFSYNMSSLITIYDRPILIPSYNISKYYNIHLHILIIYIKEFQTSCESLLGIIN